MLVQLLLAASCWIGLALAVAAQQRPNMVVMLADDLSQLDCSPYGAADISSPNMQRLAKSGLSFTRAYVASPSCAPSRAALLTGLMPARNGAEANHSKPRMDLKKWPAWFKELGYEVVAFGKVSHYKHTADYGFDHFAHDAFHEDVAIPAAVKWLKARPSENAKPLCLLVGTNWPHVPWPEQAGDYQPEAMKLPAGSIDTPATRQWRARYAAAVTKADDELGVIYDTTRQMLGESTLFVFTSDHGAQWPWAKWNCYEAGVRVPMLVSWPGRVAAGAKSDAMVSWIDLLPTLVEAAGGQPLEKIDGQSFLPVLLGQRGVHRSRIFTTHSGDGRWNIYPIRSVRNDRWKYIRNLHPEFAFTTHIDLPGKLGQRTFFETWEAAAKNDAAAAAIVKRYHQRPAEELYDLENDPVELHNLAAGPAHLSQLQSLRAELATWMQEQGDMQTVFAEPRLLSDPKSFGPEAPGGNVPARKAKQAR